MKKLLSVFTALCLTAAMITVAHGDNDVTVLIDGVALTSDVPPQIIDDFTFVPMRAIFEALGAEVTWYESTRTVASTRGNTEIIMVIGNDEMRVNDDVITLEAPPRIVGDRTLVPARAVAESFDCRVDWDGVTRTVTITTSPVETPSPSQTPAVTIGGTSTAAPESTKSPSYTSSPVKTTEPNETDAPAETTEPGETDAPAETTEPSETDAPAETEAPSPQATPSPSPAPAAQTAAVSESGEDGIVYHNDRYIEYDDTNERQSSSVKNFVITSVYVNDAGKLDITYTLQTYNDSSGKVAPTFNCYDSEGRLVDTFVELFQTWAYSWTDQDGAATISGETVRIELADK